MVAMETKIKHFKYISYHAKIIKFSFGHTDFHIIDFKSKFKLWLKFQRNTKKTHDCPWLRLSKVWSWFMYGCQTNLQYLIVVIKQSM